MALCITNWLVSGGYFKLFHFFFKMFVEIQLVEGKSLFLSGKENQTCNLFCEFKLATIGTKTQRGVKSSIVKRTNNPQWRERLFLESKDLAKESLLLYVFNRSKLLGDSPMGDASVPISDLLLNETRECNANIGKTGKVVFSVRVVEEKREPRLIKAGYLEKQTKFASWQTRWFLLKQDGLFWYQYHTSTNSLGGITDFSTVELCESINKREFTSIFGNDRTLLFSLKTPKKIYYLKAKTMDDRRAWITAFVSLGAKLVGSPVRGSVPDTTTPVDPPSNPRPKYVQPSLSSPQLNYTHKEEPVQGSFIKPTVAVESPPQSPIQPTTSVVETVVWETHIDPLGRSYYVDYVNKQSTYEAPKMQGTQTSAALPPGWEMVYDPMNRPYFVNRGNGISTYQDIRLV